MLMCKSLVLKNKLFCSFTALSPTCKYFLDQAANIFCLVSVQFSTEGKKDVCALIFLTEVDKKKECSVPELFSTRPGKLVDFSSEGRQTTRQAFWKLYLQPLASIFSLTCLTVRICTIHMY